MTWSVRPALIVSYGGMKESIHSDLYQSTINLLSLGIFMIYLGFYIAFNTIQVMSQRVVGRAEETST